MTIREFAPAKINLALHVTGQRTDGYHLLDSLVCFANVGDWISVHPAQDLTLQISGPFGDGLAVEDNLVLQAAKLLQKDQGAQIILEKNLPVSSGIGGGSADAATCLRALQKLWRCPAPSLAELITLGADVPVCHQGNPARMRGIGEQIEPVPNLPVLDAVLANPGIEVSTVGVFSQLVSASNSGLDGFPTSSHFDDWVEFLLAQRNDLQVPAIEAAPEIAGVLADLDRTPSCVLARMSGSGATCFGIYPDSGAAQAAAAQITAKHSAWWVCTAKFGRKIMS